MPRQAKNGTVPTSDDETVDGPFYTEATASVEKVAFKETSMDKKERKKFQVFKACPEHLKLLDDFYELWYQGCPRHPGINYHVGPLEAFKGFELYHTDREQFNNWLYKTTPRDYVGAPHPINMPSKKAMLEMLKPKKPVPSVTAKKTKPSLPIVSAAPKSAPAVEVVQPAVKILTYPLPGATPKVEPPPVPAAKVLVYPLPGSVAKEANKPTQVSKESKSGKGIATLGKVGASPKTVTQLAAPIASKQELPAAKGVPPLNKNEPVASKECKPTLAALLTKQIKVVEASKQVAVEASKQVAVEVKTCEPVEPSEVKKPQGPLKIVLTSTTKPVLALRLPAKPVLAPKPVVQSQLAKPVPEEDSLPV